MLVDLRTLGQDDGTCLWNLGNEQIFSLAAAVGRESDLCRRLSVHHRGDDPRHVEVLPVDVRPPKVPIGIFTLKNRTDANDPLQTFSASAAEHGFQIRKL